MFPYCKDTAQSSSSFSVEGSVDMSVKSSSATAARTYTWTVTQDPCKCGSRRSLLAGSCRTAGVHSFMMAISKECETAAKRFTMLVNGQVRAWMAIWWQASGSWG